MKTVFYSFLLCALAASTANADNCGVDLSSALQDGGVSNLLRTVKSNGFTPPRIPSKWHLEHRAATDAEKQQATKSRELGFEIVAAIEDERRIQCDSFADEMLFKQAIMLLDFSDWCIATIGWGNMLLAYECLELSAIASIRLTANTNFPIEKCEMIISRLSPEWMNPRERAAILNNEAGTNLFTLAFVESTEELDMACGAGWYLSRYKNRTPPSDTRLPPNKSLNIDIAKSNLDFFEEAPFSPNFKSLRASWDYRMTERFQGGFGYSICRDAEDIVDFRKTIGYFPEKFVRTEAEQRQLEEDIKEYAKWGLKIRPVEEEPSFDPMHEAFKRTWYKRPNRTLGDENGYVNAFWAYKRVVSGVYGGREFSSDNVNETP